MKAVTALLAVSMLLAGATPGKAYEASSLAPPRQSTEGELLVRFTRAPEAEAAVFAHAVLGSEVLRTFREIGWQHVRLPKGMSVADGLAYYRALETVAAVEPNYAVRPAGAVPDDPQFASQWNLQKIGMTNAWAVTTGSTNVVVAVIDTGVNYLHEDLWDNMWRNPGESGLDGFGRDRATNAVDDDTNGYVDDVYGIDAGDQDSDPMDEGFTAPPATTAPFHHGTQVAGIIGAVGDNHKGVAGVNWAVKLMALKFDSGQDQLDPTNVHTFNSRVIECVDYLLMMKRRGVNVRVVNNSYTVWAHSQALQDAIHLCGEEGILFVCAAGNARMNSDAVLVEFPAGENLPNVLSVAASDEGDNLFTLSVEAGSNYGQTTVDLAAPGAFSLPTTDGPDTTAYTTFGFTSGAAPHVSGAAALLWAAKADATLEQVTAALLASVDHPAALRGKLRTQGRLNVARALQVLTNDIQPALVLSAFPHHYRTMPGEPLRVSFSLPMDRASVEAGLQITPIKSGEFSWTDESRTLTFSPSMPWEPTNHTVRILGTVLDASGRSLDGNYDLTRQGSPADDFVWTFKFPLPNDDLAGAQAISGGSGQVNGSNRSASLEVDEPFFRWSGMATVWYQWQPPRSGPFTFDLVGTAFDAMLDVFVVEGPADPALDPPLGRMKRVANNNDYGTRKASRVSFLADPTTKYWIRVNGTLYSESWISSMGNFTLSWLPTPAPRLTSVSPTSGRPGTSVTLFGADFTLATTVEFNGLVTAFTAQTNYPDQRLVATVPGGAVTGPIRITTSAGTVVSQTAFVVPAPALRAQRAASEQIELSWPGVYAGWELERTPNLGAGETWTTFLLPAAVTNISPAGDWVVPASSESGGGYFRLVKRP